MNRLAVVTPFLLVPPVAIRVTELAGDSGWVDVASVLKRRYFSVKTDCSNRISVG